MYNRYIPNGMAYTRVVEEDAPPLPHPGAQRHPGQGQGSRLQGQSNRAGFTAQNSGRQVLNRHPPNQSQGQTNQGPLSGPSSVQGFEAETGGKSEPFHFQEQVQQVTDFLGRDFTPQGDPSPPPRQGQGENPSAEKKPSWLSSLLKGFKLEELDTGDILLLLILLFLFLDGESDNIEILVVLGLVILFGLGGKKDKDKEKNQPPA